MKRSHVVERVCSETSRVDSVFPYRKVSRGIGRIWYNVAIVSQSARFVGGRRESFAPAGQGSQNLALTKNRRKVNSGEGWQLALGETRDVETTVGRRSEVESYQGHSTAVRNRYGTTVAGNLYGPQSSRCWPHRTRKVVGHTWRPGRTTTVTAGESRRSFGLWYGLFP